MRIKVRHFILTKEVDFAIIIGVKGHSCLFFLFFVSSISVSAGIPKTFMPRWEKTKMGVITEKKDSILPSAFGADKSYSLSGHCCQKLSDPEPWKAQSEGLPLG